MGCGQNIRFEHEVPAEGVIFDQIYIILGA